MDSPSVNVYSDAIALGQSADGVVLVVSANSTRKEAGRRAKESLEMAGARLLGADRIIVLTPFRSHSTTASEFLCGQASCLSGLGPNRPRRFGYPIRGVRARLSRFSPGPERGHP